jgi:hypothetical protein
MSCCPQGASTALRRSRRGALARFGLLRLLDFQAWSFSARAADAGWRLSATSKSARACFDRALLREHQDDVG